MEFNLFLKNQFSAFVDTYKQNFKRTSGITFTFSVFCLVAIAVLLRFSTSETFISEKRTSLVSFLYSWNSSYNAYNLIDISKLIFLFFVSVFSLSFLRFKANSTEENPYSLKNCFKNLQIQDFAYLIAILLACTLMDYLLYLLGTVIYSKETQVEILHWLYWIVYLIKVYLPLVLFSVVIQKIVTEQKIIFNFRRIAYLLVILWLLNEFAYNLYDFVTHYIFWLIIIPFKNINHFVLESFLASLLLMLYFLGYSAAMTSTLDIAEHE